LIISGSFYRDGRLSDTEIFLFLFPGKSFELCFVRSTSLNTHTHTQEGGRVEEREREEGKKVRKTERE
jgi:hypothetical protein